MRSICIIDYGMGNLSSVASALSFLGYRAEATSDPERLGSADGLILPGVGAFAEAMRRLNDSGLVQIMERRVLRDHVPILGICLGMQLLAQSSTEYGFHAGLGWIEATVDRIPEVPGIRIPHIGWNEVTWQGKSPLSQNVAADAHFYFNHSYCMQTKPDLVMATTGFGSSIVAAVTQENIFGTQFHPEKSQSNGLKLLRNFLNYVETTSGKAAA